MPFEKVEPQADFPALERQVLSQWASGGIFEKRKALNVGKPPWSFLDGPITANNPMGVHHAWNRTYKDAFNRYFAMNGRELRYQQGFDCQGLWVEVEVEKSLELKSKRDIENLVPGDVDASIDRFVQACKDRVNHFARVQTNQSIRLGYWMNWDTTDEDWAKSPDDRQSYFTMSETNNYTIWHFLKKCHARGGVYRGYDVMPWCGRCGVGISEQEMKEGYKLVEHRAAFVRLPLIDRPNENLLVWTTTPWTLSSNVGAAVNPKLTYLKILLKGEIYYLSKGAFKLDRMAGGEDAEEGAAPAGAAPKKGRRAWLEGVPHLSSLEQMFKSKAGKEGFEIVGEVLGQTMLGWKYIGPFDELPAQQHAYGYPAEVAKIVADRDWCDATTGQESHRVISGGDDVSDNEGTGIVHTAPGCGQIDLTWGKENRLPPIAPVDDSGCFHDGFGPLAGLNAAEPATADAIFDWLKSRDRLFATERYVHRYPHCWRCKKELLYRFVDEWFIDMGPRLSTEGIRGEVMNVVDQVTFLPASINGRARERDWLRNMGDWMISKKRYWGLALPIWVDELDPTQFEVIGSREELEARAIEGWDTFAAHTPHRPWVDQVVIRNPKTGNRMHRVKDVGNPWLDAGVVAFSTMKFHSDPDYWQKWYPADFITESFPGQFRNWFYSLLTMSTLLSDGRPPFKTMLGFATVQDQFGKPMHKSDGNSIEFIGAADEGFELFRDVESTADSTKALAELPRGYLNTREESITLKDKPYKRIVAKYKPIGADVIRWLYCRQSPAQNVNFGPEPTDEVRAKFIIKLWNCYAFFVNYAIADGYDPTAPAVPVADRPDLDRWILSDLQGLIRTARESFETYDLMTFAIAAERFVDDRLSNWYVRRNRDRFWSKATELDAAGKRDKLAAYQTLHTTLRTFCQLIAPCVPFLSETLWKNLRHDSEPESVHLCDYPTADDSLYDAELSTDLDVVLGVVTLGGAARNQAKQKVRQPLAELRVHADSAEVRRAVTRFAETIADELNVKAVTVHESPLLTESVKISMKTAGAKIGAKKKEVEAAIQNTTPRELAAKLRTAGSVELAGVLLESADLQFDYTAETGWFGAVERGTQVSLDGRLTPALRAEGLSRDVIRFVQDARKNAGLDLSDTITLHLASSGELESAIRTHTETIAAAVQATTITNDPLTDASAYSTSVKLEGQDLRIALQKNG